MSSFISTDQELRQGDVLFSENKDFKAVFQHDSNFVVYKWQPVWASDTWHKDGFRILVQQDGNLVMYTKDDRPVWATNTGGNAVNNRMRLTMTNDGKLVLDRNGEGAWNSDENIQGK